jgi:hypothetical protein
VEATETLTKFPPGLEIKKGIRKKNYFAVRMNVEATGPLTTFPPGF